MKSLVQAVDLGTAPRMFDLYIGLIRVGYVGQVGECRWRGWFNGHGQIVGDTLLQVLGQAETIAQEGDKA